MAERDLRRAIRGATIRINELKPDIELLTRMLQRTTKIVAPKAKKISPIAGDGEIKIALISRALRWESDGASERNVEELRRNRFLKGLRHLPDKIDLVRESFLSDIEAAANSGAHVVCFGEGTFPWEHEPDDLAERVRRNTRISKDDRVVVDAVSRRNELFSARIQKICDQEAILVVAGSAHDRDCANIARVYSPGCGGPVSLQKIFPSLAMKEKLLPRDTTEMIVCDAGDYYVLVLVCIDAYVPATALRCALMAVKGAEAMGQHKPVRYIFVPSLNDKGSTSIKSACEDLSQLCDCVVAYVNCQIQEPRFSIFASGYLVDDHKFGELVLANVEPIGTQEDDTKGVVYSIPPETIDGLSERNSLSDGHLFVNALKNAASDRLVVGNR